jgi:hypothetical protein
MAKITKPSDSGKVDKALADLDGAIHEVEKSFEKDGLLDCNQHVVALECVNAARQSLTRARKWLNEANKRQEVSGDAKT